MTTLNLYVGAKLTAAGWGNRTEVLWSNRPFIVDAPLFDLEARHDRHLHDLMATAGVSPTT